MTAAVARSQRVSNRSSSAQRAGRTSARARSGSERSNSTRANVVRPQLKVLDQQAVRRRARRRNLAMTMFMVVIIGFFAAALAQAQLVANQHELDLLRTQIAEAEANRARLERQVDESSAPSAIIDRAQEIGMVRANDPIYLAATTSVPEILVMSTIGSATATTDVLRGTHVAIDSSIDEAVGENETAAGAAVADVVIGSSPDAASSSGVATAPATFAGIRAVASGVGTG